MFRPTHNNKGVALILIMAAITILLVIGTTLISRSVSETVYTNRYVASTRAFWLAEGGVHRAIYSLSKSDWTGWTGDANNKAITTTFSIGNFTVLVTNATGNPVISSLGNTALGSRGVNATLAKTSPPLFTYAAFGNVSVSMSGNGKSDSYNSDLGTYGGSNIASNGDIGTNGAGVNVIDLSGNTHVYGDASTGLGGTVRLNGNAEVLGNTTHTSSEDFPAPVVPGALSGLTSGGSYTLSGNGSGTLSGGDYKYSSLSVSGNGQLIINGNVRIYLTGSSSLSTSGNGKITVSAGSSLSIYSDGTCSISGNGVVNNTNLPRNFLIYSTYTGSNGISVSGNGNILGAIYAPETGVSVTGNGDIFGAVVGKNVVVSGNGCIHYDEALRNLSGFAYRYDVQVWREQSGPYRIQ